MMSVVRKKTMWQSHRASRRFTWDGIPAVAFATGSILQRVMNTLLLSIFNCNVILLFNELVPLFHVI